MQIKLLMYKKHVHQETSGKKQLKVEGVWETMLLWGTLILMGLNLDLPAVFWFTTPSNLPAYNNNKKLERPSVEHCWKCDWGKSQPMSCSIKGHTTLNNLVWHNFQCYVVYIPLYAYIIIYLFIFLFLFSNSVALNILGLFQVLCTMKLYTDHRNVSHNFVWHNFPLWQKKKNWYIKRKSLCS